MGQGKLHTAILLAGIFTLGAVFGHSEKADAAPITLAETVITSKAPTDACTEFSFLADESVRCEDDGQTYDSDHFLITTDADYPGSFYLVVWQ